MDLLHKLFVSSHLSWIIGGDFNEIVSHIEKEGDAIRSDSQIDVFRKVIDNCHLMDPNFARRKLLEKDPVGMVSIFEKGWRKSS